MIIERCVLPIGFVAWLEGKRFEHWSECPLVAAAKALAERIGRSA